MIIPICASRMVRLASLSFNKFHKVTKEKNEKKTD